MSSSTRFARVLPPLFPLFFFRMRWTPVRGSTWSLTVQYEPLPRSVNGRATFSKQGLRERLWRTEFFHPGGAVLK